MVSIQELPREWFEQIEEEPTGLSLATNNGDFKGKSEYFNGARKLDLYKSSKKEYYMRLMINIVDDDLKYSWKTKWFKCKPEFNKKVRNSISKMKDE